MTQPEDELTTLDEELKPARRDIEAPDADAVEQSLPVNPAEQPVRPSSSPEVGEWDALEQARVVDMDDDYR